MRKRKKFLETEKVHFERQSKSATSAFITDTTSFRWEIRREREEGLK